MFAWWRIITIHAITAPHTVKASDLVVIQMYKGSMDRLAMAAREEILYTRLSASHVVTVNRPVSQLIPKIAPNAVATPLPPSK